MREKREGFGERHTGEHRKTRRLELSQAKECQELPEAGRDEGTFFPEVSERTQSCPHLDFICLDFKTMQNKFMLF